MTDLKVNDEGLVAVRIIGGDYAGTLDGKIGHYDPLRAQWLLDNERGELPVAVASQEPRDGSTSAEPAAAVELIAEGAPARGRGGKR